MDPISLVVLGLMFMGRKSKAPGEVFPTAPIPQMPPPPSGAVVPSSITQTHFPGPRWEADNPPSQAVQDRAMALLSSLWARGEGSHQTEDMGPALGLPGPRPTAFIARRHGTKKAVEAYRMKAGTVITSPTPPSPSREAVKPRPRKTDQASIPTGKSTLQLPTLRLGSAGTDVQVLQQRLGTTSVDGKFGPKTEAAVIDFQVSNGIKVDGIVGPETWGALFADGN